MNQNEDELDQNELLGIIDEDPDDTFGLNEDYYDTNRDENQDQEETAHEDINDQVETLNDQYTNDKFEEKEAEQPEAIIEDRNSPKRSPAQPITEHLEKEANILNNQEVNIDNSIEKISNEIYEEEPAAIDENTDERKDIEESQISESIQDNERSSRRKNEDFEDDDDDDDAEPRGRSNHWSERANNSELNKSPTDTSYSASSHNKLSNNDYYRNKRGSGTNNSTINSNRTKNKSYTPASQPNQHQKYRNPNGTVNNNNINANNVNPRYLNGNLNHSAPYKQQQHNIIPAHDHSNGLLPLPYPTSMPPQHHVQVAPKIHPQDQSVSVAQQSSSSASFMTQTSNLQMPMNTMPAQFYNNQQFNKSSIAPAPAQTAAVLNMPHNLSQQFTNPLSGSPISQNYPNRMLNMAAPSNQQYKFNPQFNPNMPQFNNNNNINNSFNNQFQQPPPPIPTQQQFGQVPRHPLAPNQQQPGLQPLLPRPNISMNMPPESSASMPFQSPQILPYQNPHQQMNPNFHPNQMHHHIAPLPPPPQQQVQPQQMQAPISNPNNGLLPYPNQMAPSNNTNQFNPVQMPPVNQPPMIKSIYINPSFIPKQQKPPTQQTNTKTPPIANSKHAQSNPHQSTTNERQNILKDHIDNKIPGNSSDDSKSYHKKSDVTQSQQASIKTTRSRKDLELLLEKRLAAELMSESQSTSTNPTQNGPSKRKSVENSQEKKIEDKKPTKEDHQSRNSKDSTSLDPPPHKKPTPSESSEPKSMIIIDDPDYAKKLEEQKRKREEILKAKEEKRNQRILELKKNENLNTGDTSDLKSSKSSTTAKTRTVITDESSRAVTTSSSSSLGSQSKRIIVQNLSLDTTDKKLLSMCNSINIKDKVNSLHKCFT